MDIDAFGCLNVPKPDEKSGVVDPTDALISLARRSQSRNLVIMVGTSASDSAGLAPWAEIGNLLKETLYKTDGRIE